MKAFYEGVATDVQIIYIRTVKERFGVDLMDFYAQYPQLCSDICDAVEAKEPYDRLVTGRSKLVELESAEAIPPGSAGDLDAATEHPLGIEAIGMYYWDRINPLLERAYTLFEPITLNAPYLMS
jgi:hypothetical protein